MNIKTLKKAGICFDYSRFAVIPQIPCVQDVLYALRLTEEEHHIANGSANWVEYIANTHLVAAAVASKVLFMERYDEVEVRKIIAEAILDLCPPEAKCLFNSTFVSAQEEFVGKPAPSRRASRDEILRTCGCMECARIVREQDCVNDSMMAGPEDYCGVSIYDS